MKQLGTGASLEVEQAKRERDLIDQVNRALRERDAAVAELRRRSRIYTFCAASGSTTGAGMGFSAFTGLQQVGCRLQVLTNAIRVNFDTPRPTPIHYVVRAIHTTSAALRRFAVLSAKNENSCDVLFVRSDDTQVVASNTAVDFMISVEDYDE